MRKARENDQIHQCERLETNKQIQIHIMQYESKEELNKRSNLPIRKEYHRLDYNEFWNRIKRLK